MNRTASFIIIFGLIIALSIIFLSSPKTKTSSDENASIQNSEIKNGVQYITINAHGGYSPRLSEAKAGIPTKLIVKTNGTYDCSAALSIRSLGFQKILPNTGETEIDLGTPTANTPIQGICGMGMYNFSIDFK